MKIRRLTAFVAGAAAAALAVSACTPPDEGGDTGTGGDDSGIQTDTAVTVGWNQPFYEYNTSSATGNATANANILYLIQESFNYYDPELNLVQNEDFGTYEVINEDPLTVEYTFADDNKWSDGTPVDAVDLLLQWGATSGHFNTIGDEEIEYDDEGNVTNQDEVDSNVYFNGTSATVGYIGDVELSEDNKTLTATYDVNYADWEVNLTGAAVPAHVVAMHALDIEDPAEAKQAIKDAFENEDTEALAAISKFWNEGFAFGDSLPEDKSLYLSNGAYELVEMVAGQYVTLQAREDFTGSHAASVERITVRYNEDPMQQVLALENGEIDVMAPQATADLVEALNGLGDGYTVLTGIDGTYEHVDLQFTNGGPFDPETYGGDEETALKVRQAFLKLIPRQEIVDKLIKPLNPEAEVRQSYNVVPGSPMYDGVVAANGQAEAFPLENDVAGAEALMEEAGVETPVDVRILFGASNARRQQEYAIMAEAFNQSGLFNLVDASSDDWGSMLDSATDQYDAALFGWQSTSTAVTAGNANYGTGQINNFYGYSNPEVDELQDQLSVETDPAEQERLLGEIEAHLVNDAFGVTIFQFPSVTAYRNTVTGIDPITISPTVFYGFWNWGTTGDTAEDPGEEG
ncbi:MAG TPA: ABC transporter family substrate-binding protein [Actinotalea caeni]|uniref:ABC transporter family substrate-binding protein n=1 Tax=Actinotalea caeni TaxID=1348467 RepID=UPI002B4AD112|nr:ABC transporter family substrate-binding protein [Actinotalea caeni]HLV56226.1 ABC transporter family substrate-binding protein [Actinotalea caeni]